MTSWNSKTSLMFFQKGFRLNAMLVSAAIFVLAMISTGIILAFYFNEKTKMLDNAESILETISDSKVHNIVNWLQSQYDIANYVAESLTATTAVQWIDENKQQQADTILIRFKSLLDNFHFRSAFLADPAGRLLLKSGSAASDYLEQHVKDSILEAFKTCRPVLSDLNIDSHNSIHMELTIPLFYDNHNPAGAFIFFIDPHDFLYPLIEAWPTKSRSVETLLARRENDKVLYLNELRFKKNSAMKLMAAKDQNELPVVKAVLLNETGAVDGTDYRGEKVKAFSRIIPGTHWIMISKVDLSEILEPMKDFTALVFILIISVLLTSSLVFMLVKQFINKRYYKNLYEMGQTLDKSETMYRELFQNTPSGIVVYEACNGGEDFIIRDFNTGAEKIENIKRENVIGRLVTEVFPGVKEFGFLEIFSRVYKTSKSEFFPAHFYKDQRHSDGAWYENWVHKLPTGEIIAIYNNVTKHEKTNILIKRNEERFRSFITATANIIWVTDQNGKLVEDIPTWREFTGQSYDEIKGNGWLNALHPDDLPGAREVWKNSIMNKTFYRIEYRVRRSDGVYRIFGVRGVPVFNEDGTIREWIGSCNDITERINAEKDVKELSFKINRTFEEIVNVLSLTVEMRDLYTAGHSRRTTKLACAIAENMGLPAERIKGLRIAGLLHDIGKISIPTEILSKPGPLTALEYSIIKTHSQAGYDALKVVDFPWPVARIVLEHHERIDGSGYPGGKKGHDLLTESKILAVADVLEAMSFDRPYRKGFGFEKAISEIVLKQGILYDPEVTAACKKLYANNKFNFLI